MKKLIQSFTLLSLIILLSNSCKKIDQFTQFNMDFNNEIIIPSSTGINLPINLLTPEMETNSESTFEINDTRKDLIEEIRLTSLTLYLSSPNNADFSFLESISVYMNAQDLPEVEIAWESKALLHPCLLEDESTALLNDALMEPQLQQVLRASLHHRVESQISQHLQAGNTTPDLIASDLNMGTRTLQRLLKEDGTSFKEILKLLRQEHAKNLLDTREPIAQIASRLGYDDPGTFSKAFKAWFGLSPSDYLENKKNPTKT